VAYPVSILQVRRALSRENDIYCYTRHFIFVFNP
jgi:hypothetical protein